MVDPKNYAKNKSLQKKNIPVDLCSRRLRILVNSSGIRAGSFLVPLSVARIRMIPTAGIVLGMVHDVSRRTVGGVHGPRRRDVCSRRNTRMSIRGRRRGHHRCDGSRRGGRGGRRGEDSRANTAHGFPRRGHSRVRRMEMVLVTRMVLVILPVTSHQSVDTKVRLHGHRGNVLHRPSLLRLCQLVVLGGLHGTVDHPLTVFAILLVLGHNTMIGRISVGLPLRFAQAQDPIHRATQLLEVFRRQDHVQRLRVLHSLLLTEPLPFQSLLFFLQRVLLFETSPTSQVRAVLKHVVTVRVQRPVTALPRLLIVPRNFDETLVQTQIVSYRVLPALQTVKITLFCKCLSKTRF